MPGTRTDERMHAGVFAPRGQLDSWVLGTEGGPGSAQLAHWPSACRCTRAPPARTAGTPRSSTTAPGSGRRRPPGGSGCHSPDRSTGCCSWLPGSTPCLPCQGSTCWAGRSWVSPPCRPGPRAGGPGPWSDCLAWQAPTAPGGPRPRWWHWTP